MRLRSVLAVSILASALYGSCVEHDYQNELGRVGGPIPDYAAQADVTVDATASEASASDGAPLIPFCEAYKVMSTCRCCHFGQPPPVGDSIGPFPLLTYPDTQAFYSGKPVYERMKAVLKIDYMPLIDPCDPDCVTDPPAKPLDPGCKQTLVDWLNQNPRNVGEDGGLFDPATTPPCDPSAQCQADIGCYQCRDAVNGCASRIPQ